MINIFYDLITSTICTKIIDLEGFMKPLSILFKYSSENP